MPSDIQPFFSPHGVALIGASTSPQKLSYGILENMSRYGFTGNIYPVNPNAKEILGHTCFADISQVPDPVDLAVIVLPAQVTLPVMKACGERGIKSVIIISGGFKEVRWNRKSWRRRMRTGSALSVPIVWARSGCTADSIPPSLMACRMSVRLGSSPNPERFAAEWWITFRIRGLDFPSLPAWVMKPM
jgi:predicted CoA-binding protein